MARKSLQYQIMILALALLVASITFVKTQPATAATTPKLTLSPTTALPNQSVAVTGENFTTGGTETLSSITIGSIAVDSSKINFGSTVKVDNSGRFVTNLVVPINSATLAAGGQSVTATDSKGVSASATLTISTPTITISPTKGRAGSTVTVTGSKYPMASSSSGTDDVPLVRIRYYLTPTNSHQVVTALPDSTGAFSTTFKIPLQVTIPSTDNVVEASMSDTAIKVTAKHSVTEPSISASPSSGGPGTALTITGTDFSSFIPVESLTIGGRVIDIGTGQHTNGDGKVTLNAIVPNLDAGTQPIFVQVNGNIYNFAFSVTENTSTVSSSQAAIDQTTFSLNNQPTFDNSNLVSIFHFNNETKQWAFYDTNPEFAPFITLTELTKGKAYWIKVKRTQITFIAGTQRPMLEGWNLVAW